MESEIVFEVVEASEGGYTARALGYPIFTEGDSLEDLRDMVREAVLTHFDHTAQPRAVSLQWIEGSRP